MTIEAFDLLGRRVALLASGPESAGDHSLTWNADRHPSGMYLIRISTTEGSSTIKVNLLK